MSVEELSDFPHFNSIFVHAKYTSSMAACYDTDVSDVTAPHV